MFKVWVLADNSGTWATNAKTFDSTREAEVWAIDLAKRWILVKAYHICSLTENPNTDELKGAVYL